MPGKDSGYTRHLKTGVKHAEIRRHEQRKQSHEHHAESDDTGILPDNNSASNRHLTINGHPQSPRKKIRTSTIPVPTDMRQWR